MNKIPKIIHYCWFGGNELPKSAKKCIESWKKYLPEYEIKEWNESNFDYSCCQYAKEAFETKKWAFVSDFARFKILYEEGGIYFDVDVEVIKPLGDILKEGAFMGRQHDYFVAPGLGMAVSPKHSVIKEILDLYSNLSFVNKDGMLNLKTVVQYTTEVLNKYGLENIDVFQNILGINIYPKEYFSPKDPVFKTLNITKNTYTIHHFDGSWLSKKVKIKLKIQRFCGKGLTSIIVKIKDKMRKMKEI